MIYAIARVLFFMYYHIFFRFKVSGRENVPKHGGVIICANHSSVNDGLILGTAVKRPLHFVAKGELFKNPFFSFVLKQINCIPVNREKADMAMYKSVVGVLKKGKVAGIFAQGKRFSEIDAKSAKSGVALFAIKGNASVVPVNITSTYKFFSKIYVTIGEPIILEEYGDKKVRTEELNKITEDIMNKISSLAPTGGR